jgi:hypothetical protein
VPDGIGGVVEMPFRFPVWVHPTADGKTPMCGALRRAGTVVSGFLAEHPNAFPPLVINVTDGEANDGDPEVPAGKLRQLSSLDGHVLLFNVHISSRPGPAVEFPDREAGLPDHFARRLFRMSSTLPPPLWHQARQAGLALSPNARGFVFNADLASVIRFLDIGTRVDFRNLRG